MVTGADVIFVQMIGMGVSLLQIIWIYIYVRIVFLAAVCCIMITPCSLLPCRYRMEMFIALRK